jgi:hypothetical protein
MNPKDRAEYKAKLIKSLKELGVNEQTKEDKEEAWSDEPPEAPKPNPAFSKKKMDEAVGTGRVAVHGRMRDLNEMREEDRAEKIRKRKAWMNMKPIKD